MNAEVEKTQTNEEVFLGTRTEVGAEDAVDDLKVEVVDDRPPEDQRPAANKSAVEPVDKHGAKGASEDDLDDYGEKVKKRINKEVWKTNEVRREKDEAIRLRDEAISFAESAVKRNQQYEEALKNQKEDMIQRIKKSAQDTIVQAKANYKAAFEAGNTEQVLEAQETLTRSQSELLAAENYEAEQLRQQQYAQPEFQPRRQPAQQPVQQPPKPTEKAAQWATDNPWFGSDDHKDMTALAYGVHETLIRDEGMDPNTDEYYEAINKAMRSRFPEYFVEGVAPGDENLPGDDGSGRQPASPQRKHATTVAPSQRNNGAAPAARTVKLTSTQAALAKRLGLTLEQYANQLVKEM
jgi:hypothetical protein